MNNAPEKKDAIKKIIEIAEQSSGNENKTTGSLGDDIAKYSRIKKYLATITTDNSSEKERIEKSRQARIALLSSFTTNGMKESLFVKCCRAGVLPEIYVSGYNQYAQEILNATSQLYEFHPEIIFLFFDTKSLFGDAVLMPYPAQPADWNDITNNKLKEIEMFIDILKERTSAKIVVHNLMVPSYSPLGILEIKSQKSFLESIRKMNQSMSDMFKNDSTVFVFDYEAFCARIGKNNIIDYKLYFLGDIRLALQHIPTLCQEYLAYIKSLKSLTKKCIVLDLDNTLWGGIVGEDGFDGIKLGPTPEGRPFLEFQQYLLSLFNKGVILAINSKNNYSDAIKVIKEHPYMILREEHFAAIKINWNDKISNMKSIAEEINIGLDSIVFFDDDKFNREMIRGSLPEVLVIELPEDPSLYLKTLMTLNDFDSFHLTEEDLQKGKMYAEQRKRTEFQSRATDITEYLKGLQMKVTIDSANTFNIPRVSQLTQKTNQFNMTTKRYLEEDIKKMNEYKNHIIASVKVEDKFGDNGITGAIIIEKYQDEWRIDTFLLSCRVIGRRVEETLLAHIIEEAAKENVKTIIGMFIPTKKNEPAKGFYEKVGFTLSKIEGDKEIWEFKVGKKYKYPEFIEVIIKNDEFTS